MRGTVVFKHERRSTGKVVDQFLRRYAGEDWETYKFRGIPVGKYVVRVRFNIKPALSVYKNDRDSLWQSVRPRR